MPRDAKILRSAPEPELTAGGRVVASTDRIDRNGRRVVQNWDLDGYRANPVLLYGHDAETRLPIGRAEVEVTGSGDSRRLEAEPHFDTSTAFNAAVAAHWDKGLLRAVSIGWVPSDWEEVRDVFSEATGAYLYTEYPRNELLEISVVPVPANPDATRLAAALGLEPELAAIAQPPHQLAAAKDRSAARGRTRLRLAQLQKLRRRKNR